MSSSPFSSKTLFPLDKELFNDEFWPIDSLNIEDILKLFILNLY